MIWCHVVAKHPRKAQQGFVALLVVFLVVLATAAYLANALNSNMVNTDKDIRTSAALAEAKAALINWSVANSTMPGTLPCPDTDNSGTENPSIAAQQCLAKIGRLPWQTLGLKDIRDGYGECLWYALTPVYGDAIPTAARSVGAGNVINSAVAGAITIQDATGANLPPAINPVIAVIFAAGPALNVQDRTTVGNPVCGGNVTASNYLDTDTASGIDNSTGNGRGDTFIAGAPSTSFNDKLVYITAHEFYQSVSKRIVRELLGNVAGNSGLIHYYNNNANTFPCPLGKGPVCPGAVGNIDPTGLNYPQLSLWLTNNNWFATETYKYTNPTHVKVTVPYPAGSYSCDANANIFTCSSP